MEFNTHKGPEDQEKERTTDYESLRKKVAMDLYYEKYREHIQNLPLHEKIKFLQKVMKEDYGIHH